MAVKRLRTTRLKPLRKAGDFFYTFIKENTFFWKILSRSRLLRKQGHKFCKTVKSEWSVKT